MNVASSLRSNGTILQSLAPSTFGSAHSVIIFLLTPRWYGNIETSCIASLRLGEVRLTSRNGQVFPDLIDWWSFGRSSWYWVSFVNCCVGCTVILAESFCCLRGWGRRGWRTWNIQIVRHPWMQPRTRYWRPWRFEYGYLGNARPPRGFSIQLV